MNIDYINKSKFYAELASEVDGLLTRYWFSNLSNVSALLNQHLPNINWVGFYLNVDGVLQLGPFQGKVACLTIPFGKGVCGTAAEKREAQIVPDVHKFPGHIQCDSASNSEIVLPLLLDGKVVGVLDIDSPAFDRFDKEDQNGLQKIIDILIVKTNWSIK